MRALTIAGVLLDDTKLQLDPGFIVDADIPDQEGELEVEALDRGKTVLARTRLALQSPCALPIGSDLAPSESGYQVCVGLAAFPEETHEVRIVRHGKALYSRFAPASPAEFDVKWPQDFDRAPSTFTVSWFPSSDGYLGALGYSNDGGKSWLPVSAPTSEGQLTVDWSNLPGGSACVFELMATDGWTTQRFRSPSIDVPLRGWRLWITSPSNGQVINSDQPLSLVAYSFHVERRVSEPLSIEWTSSIDGSLGSGGSVACYLTAGTHLVVARKADVSQEITVVVRPV
jgi:hypothetical protein